MILAQNRTALVSIYLSPEQLSDRNSTALYAAKELRYYLDRMTCASFQIEEAKAHTAGIYIGDISGIDRSLGIEYRPHQLSSGNSNPYD